MPKRVRQCADYVAENTDRIAVSTVSQLAQEAGVQPSAFMRFCQVLGFTGFSEMQRLFRDSFKQAWPDYTTRLQNLQEGHADDPSVLLADFAEAGRVSLERLLVSVDHENLNASVDLLAKAPVIHLIGYRRAFPVVSYLAYAFEKMAIPAILHDGVGQLNAAHSIRKGDAVVAVTFAPYSAETIELVAASKDLGRMLWPLLMLWRGLCRSSGRFPCSSQKWMSEPFAPCLPACLLPSAWRWRLGRIAIKSSRLSVV